jgi:hypothetical protein
MTTISARSTSLPHLVLSACVALLSPLPAQAQTGILHKQTYGPSASLAATAAPLRGMAGRVSSLPATAEAGSVAPGVAVAPGETWGHVVSGEIVGAPGLVGSAPGGTPGFVPGSAPGYRGHHGRGFDGDAVMPIPLPAPASIDFGHDVQIMPYPFDVDRPHAVSTMAVSAQAGMARVEMAQSPSPHRLAGTTTAAAARLARPGETGVLQAHPLGFQAKAGRGVVPEHASRPAESPASPKKAAAGAEGMANLQRVGVERSATQLRWIDRLRFSWPGSSE